MPNVARVLVTWQGFQGAPGYTRLSFGNVTDATTAKGATDATRAFFVAIGTLLRTGWTLTVSPVVELHDMDTGMLQSEINVTPAPVAVAGTGSAATPWAAGVGAYITWRTQGIFFGKRVKGRSYLVPLLGVADVDGSLLATAQTTIQSAADSLVNAAGADLIIWSRRYAADGSGTQIQGAMNSVTVASVPDKTGILRSRRD